jgi:coenzyme Q-binding protein COQ10
MLRGWGAVRGRGTGASAGCTAAGRRGVHGTGARQVIGLFPHFGERLVPAAPSAEVPPGPGPEGWAPRDVPLGLAEGSRLRRTHHEQRQVPYSAAEIYGVVADVGAYRDFLPWCVASRVHYRHASGRYLEAELGIGFRVFAEHYTSRVWLYPGRAVFAQALDTTVFHFLRNSWILRPGVDANSTLIDLTVDFAFRSALYAQVTNLFFDEVVRHMASAYEKRAERLRAERGVGWADFLVANNDAAPAPLPEQQQPPDWRAEEALPRAVAQPRGPSVPRRPLRHNERSGFW